MAGNKRCEERAAKRRARVQRALQDKNDEASYWAEGTELTVHTLFSEDTLLHFAAFRNVQLVRDLLAEGAEVNVHGDLGMTPLHNAVIAGTERIVNLLLEHGADPFLRNEFDTDVFRSARLHKRKYPELQRARRRILKERREKTD